VLGRVKKEEKKGEVSFPLDEDRKDSTTLWISLNEYTYSTLS